MFDGLPMAEFMRSSSAGPADAWVRAIGRMQIETMALVTKRLMANLEVPQALSRCTSPQDVLAEQVRYWQTAQKQYMQAYEKMSSAAGMVPVVPVPTPKLRDYIVVSDNASAKPAPKAVAQQPAESIEDAVYLELYKKSA